MQRTEDVVVSTNGTTGGAWNGPAAAAVEVPAPSARPVLAHIARRVITIHHHNNNNNSNNNNNNITHPNTPREGEEERRTVLPKGRGQNVPNRREEGGTEHQASTVVRAHKRQGRMTRSLVV